MGESQPNLSTRGSKDSRHRGSRTNKEVCIMLVHEEKRKFEEKYEISVFVRCEFH